MIRIKDIRVSAVDFKGKILELNTVFINDVEIDLEEDNSKNNLRVFLEALQLSRKNLSKDKVQGFILRDLRISNIRAMPGMSVINKVSEPVIVSPIYLQNIGLRKAGNKEETINMLMEYVINQVFKDLRMAKLSLGIKSMTQSVLELGETIQSGAVEIGSDVGSGLKDLGAQIGNVWEKVVSEEDVVK